jgi:spermidine/putrescine transport system ATP-binding protein
MSKNFGSIRAVDNLSFEVKEGEFFSLLGPSGCGKTTTLRNIAGFDSPTSGSVVIDGEIVNDVPAYERDVGMVFQGYALFPHKSVGENVGFGLKMEGVDKETREKRVAEALELVDLPGMEERSPSELSGGQQQRVALARALVIEPSVLLLDEPLSDLDLKLRQHMREELKRIQEETGITTIYVTHDQKEALSMSDRVLLMRGGQDEQIDTPYELYNEPNSEFVADFIGEANILSGEVKGVDGDCLDIELHSNDGDPVRTTVTKRDSYSRYDSGVDADGAGANGTPNKISGEITTKTFLGEMTSIVLERDDIEIRSALQGKRAQNLERNESVTIGWDAEDITLVPET